MGSCTAELYGLYFYQAAVYSAAMAENRRQLVEQFTTLVLDSIAADEASPTKPRNPVLVTTSFRSPVGFKKRLKKAAKIRGVEQTQLLIQALTPLLAVILEDEEPGTIPHLFSNK